MSDRVEREARNFHTEIESRIIKNPSLASFYRYIGSKISPQITSTQLVNEHNNRLTKPKYVAQQFNKYFSSVYNKDDDIASQFDIRTNCQMPNILFSEVEIIRVLSAMNGKGSSA